MILFDPMGYIDFVLFQMVHCLSITKLNWFFQVLLELPSTYCQIVIVLVIVAVYFKLQMSVGKVK
jgi:hypothetical protein